MYTDVANEEATEAVEKLYGGGGTISMPLIALPFVFNVPITVSVARRVPSSQEFV